MHRRVRLHSRTRNAELITDGTRQRVFDFTMAGHSRTATVAGIAVDGMIATLTFQVTAILLEMSD
jgi:hypothetical protein